jgi:hypothetical protein
MSIITIPIKIKNRINNKINLIIQINQIYQTYQFNKII